MALATSVLTAWATALTSSRSTHHLQSPTPRPLGEGRQSHDVVHLRRLGPQGRDALLRPHTLGPAVEEGVKLFALQPAGAQGLGRPEAAQRDVAARHAWLALGQPH